MFWTVACRSVPRDPRDPRAPPDLGDPLAQRALGLVVQRVPLDLRDLRDLPEKGAAFLDRLDLRDQKARPDPLDPRDRSVLPGLLDRLDLRAPPARGAAFPDLRDQLDRLALGGSSDRLDLRGRE